MAFQPTVRVANSSHIAWYVGPRLERKKTVLKFNKCNCLFSAYTFIHKVCYQRVSENRLRVHDVLTRYSGKTQESNFMGIYITVFLPNENGTCIFFMRNYKSDEIVLLRPL